MSEPAVVIALKGRTVDEGVKYASIDSDYPVPKIRNTNFGLIEYTFTTNPAEDVDYEMFEIEHNFDYIPFAFIMIGEVFAGVEQQYMTPLNSYYLKFGSDFQLGPPPTFPVYGADIEQRITARLEENRIRVYYFAARDVDAGYSDPSGFFNLETMSGRKFAFKFYIMTEGIDDDDTEAVFATT